MKLLKECITCDHTSKKPILSTVSIKKLAWRSMTLVSSDTSSYPGCVAGPPPNPDALLLHFRNDFITSMSRCQMPFSCMSVFSMYLHLCPHLQTHTLPPTERQKVQSSHLQRPAGSCPMPETTSRIFSITSSSQAQWQMPNGFEKLWSRSWI